MKMKKMSVVLFFVLLFSQMNLNASSKVDSTGMLGDNFSLEGALEMFKQSNTLEDFEKKINDPNSNVSNLDLNEDGYIDYIKVNDAAEGESHAIVLQVDINENESQDIAVIEMEKTGNNKVVLQIIGDEDLYGSDIIVEPVSSVTNKVVVVHKTTYEPVVVNVWSWPAVGYIYGPRYRVWVSPWRWTLYPRYWKPWRPHPWRVFHQRRIRYNVHYRPVHTLRVHRAHAIYRPHRRTSIVVKKKSVRRNRKGTVVKTKTKTTKVGVKTKNGNVYGAKKTTKTTTVKNRNNKVVGKKKTTKTTKVKKGKKGTKVTKTKKTTIKRRKRH